MARCPCGESSHIAPRESDRAQSLRPRQIWDRSHGCVEEGTTLTAVDRQLIMQRADSARRNGATDFGEASARQAACQAFEGGNAAGDHFGGGAVGEEREAGVTTAADLVVQGGWENRLG